MASVTARSSFPFKAVASTHCLSAAVIGAPGKSAASSTRRTWAASGCNSTSLTSGSAGRPRKRARQTAVEKFQSSQARPHLVGVALWSHFSSVVASVSQRLHRRWNPAAEPHKHGRGPALRTSITGVEPNSPPKSTTSPAFAPGTGISGHGRGFVVDHADRHLVGDDGRNRFRRGVAGNGDHIESDGTNARHGFQLLQNQVPAAHGVGQGGSSLTGMNAPLSPPPNWRQRGRPFFTASFNMATAAVDPGRRWLRCRGS